MGSQARLQNKVSPFFVFSCRRFEMIQINPPRKNHGPFGIHSECNCFVACHPGIACEERAAFQRITSHPLHPPIAICILHEVISPRHGEDRTKTAQGCKERAGLNGSGVDQIRLDLFDHSPQVQSQTRHVAPAEFASSACPQDLPNVLRDRSDLPSVACSSPIAERRSHAPFWITKRESDNREGCSSSKSR